MKIAICDDSFTDINKLHQILLSNLAISNLEIETFNSPTALLNIIKYNHSFYDVTFLDIDMPEISGIELGKLINKTSPKTIIIFVTSYPQYAIDAFECEAFHYLVKPLNNEKIAVMLRRLLNKYKATNKFHIIKVRTETIRIPIEDIYYIECCQKHIIYHMKKGEYDTVGKLSDAYNSLRLHGFQQIHQGYIVNMEKIHHFEKYSVVLIDGRRVAISIRKRTEVLSNYAHYIEEI